MALTLSVRSGKKPSGFGALHAAATSSSSTAYASTKYRIVLDGRILSVLTRNLVFFHVG